MENCIFCKIVKGELPSAKIYEDDDVLAFMNLLPVTRGHCLVIPKKHFDDIIQTPVDELNKVIQAVKNIAEATGKAMSTDSLTVSTNRGEHSGRTVLHLHFHIIPRYKTDGLTNWGAEGKQQLELKTRQEIAEAIRKHL